MPIADEFFERLSTRSRWVVEAIGPIWVPGSIASPTVSDDAKAASVPTTSS